MTFHNPNLFIVSGGAGSGKTTVLQELARLGFQHAPEIAREIIQEQVKASGKALPWKDVEAYVHLVLQRSIVSYLRCTSASTPLSCDRGIPDILCYARRVGLREHDDIQNACREYRYALRVFLAPPWKEIYRTDAERKDDFADAEGTFTQLERFIENSATKS